MKQQIPFPAIRHRVADQGHDARGAGLSGMKRLRRIRPGFRFDVANCNIKGGGW
jgi:hypothetical protein